MELIAPGWSDYEVLDAGDGLRLERLGDILITRQCAQAIWPRHLPERDWRPHAVHFRNDTGPGAWSYPRGPVPRAWPIRRERAAFEMRLTEFGHIGLFSEQETQWPWIEERLAARAGAKVLNLFGYTGGSTLAAALGGGQVTHVDAVKGVVTWARINAELSGLGAAPIRWIVEDAPRFVSRELRRGNRYDALILDPPTFGRGPDGSVWQLETSLVPMLAELEQLLSDAPLFVLLSAHTPGVTAAVLRNLLVPLVARRGGRLESGDMAQRCASGPYLVPQGVYCRWLP